MKKSSLLFLGVIIIILVLLDMGGLVLWRRWQAKHNVPNLTNSSPNTSLDTNALSASTSLIIPQNSEQKIIKWQQTTSNLFTDYDSCLPRHIAPKELKENNYPYDYLVEMTICTHDVMKKFAKKLDALNGNSDFIDSLRFGTCDECSESH